MKRIVVVSLGGTILGVGESGSDSYVSGGASVQNLLSDVCARLGINRMDLEQRLGAEITLQSLATIDSADIDSTLLLTLAREVHNALQHNNVCGVVVLQGTDTLEDSSFLLHLLSTSQKPIIFSAAMRATNALGGDGVRNFYHALVLASYPKSAKRGVLLVLNDLILSARDAIKSHTLATDAFKQGCVGYMLNSMPYFFYKPTRIHTYKLALSVEKILAPLPKVAILYGHQDDEISDFAQVLCEKYQGVVYAGLGSGNCSAKTLQALRSLDAHIPIVISSRIQQGAVFGHVVDSFIGAGDLCATKARILLQLALAHRCSRQEICEIFEQV